MALFTDGPLSCIEDLALRDSQLLDVANTEGIDVTHKISFAQEEIQIELDLLLGRLKTRWNYANVIATSPLKLWHAYRTLELVYADAFHNQWNDRYASKRDEFHKNGKWAFEKLIQQGVAVTPTPVPRPVMPEVDVTAGTLPDNAYYVTMTWVNGNGEESAPAPATEADTSGQTLIVQPGTAPAGAVGWNVFIGRSSDAMTMQNGQLIAPDQPWQQPDTLTITGRGPGLGQPPVFLQPVPRFIQRG